MNWYHTSPYGYDFAKATDQRRMEPTKEKWSAIVHLKGPAELFQKKINI